ncbi:protein phosphatase CheZ [Thiomicrospira pelophila]|uniref:protein phosphatase CheZ n=1 Tax=Thiomicrospira pelophila TaxID=934 RepID=UPI0004A74F67|nr:protein phosphatase CheZ [Thiomicrospira pelophila]
MSLLTQISISDVQTLLSDLEAGDLIAAGAQLDKLTQLREHELYQELGRMTRNLHDTLKELDDTELLQQVKHDLPDVSERLEYVMASTEEASAKTLSAAEDLAERLDQVNELIATLPSNQSQPIKALLDEASSQVTNIMMAQSFQDLTGQVLNRVMIVMGAFERSLLELISRSGHDLSTLPERSASSKREDELKGIGPNVTKSSQQDNLSSQDDVDDLLGQLGF